MKFSEYKEMRNTIEFDRKFSMLCESIALSGDDFDKWWSQKGLPVILEAHKHQNEDELLMELFGTGNNPGRVTQTLGRGVGNIGRGIGNAWNSMKQHGQEFGQAASDAYNGQPAQNPNVQQVAPEQPMDVPPENPNAAPEMSPEKQQRLDAFQRSIDQTTDQIKQRFSGAMRDFLQAVQNDAQDQNNAHMWQIAKNFNQQIMKSAQPAIDAFTQKAKFGKKEGGYMDQFSQANQAYQQNKQANMKQRLQGQYGQQQAVAPQNLSQPQQKPPTLNQLHQARENGTPIPDMTR